MKLYRRPPEPADFARKVENARDKAERLISAQLKAGAKKAPAKSGAKKSAAASAKAATGVAAEAKGKKKDKIFQDVWKDFKAIFAYAQFDKCGFCESNVLKTGRGDVEHYRPKSEVSELDDDPDTRGVQHEAAAAVTGRRPKVVCSTGYYWLAYDWSNYLLSCAICNQNFKGSVFPVRNVPRSLPPLKDSAEDALLLNPFDRKDPARHLQLRRDGFIVAKSPYGRATIDTCGLHRDILISGRRDIALRVYELARDLRRPAHRRENPQVLRLCYDYGCDDAEHCGMARAIIEEVGGMKWEDLVKKRARELALQLKNARGSNRKELDEQMEKMGRERYEHSAEVREIFEKTSGITWETLVLRLTAQMARDFLADKILWENDGEYNVMLKKKFYLLARDNPAYAAGIKDTYNRQTRMDWDELKALVEARVKMLWTLDDVLQQP